MNQRLIEQIESQHFQALELGHRLDKTAIQIRYRLQTAISINDEDMIHEADSLKEDYIQLIRKCMNIELVDDDKLFNLDKTFRDYYALARPVTIEMIRSGFSDELFDKVGRMNVEYDKLTARLNEITSKQKEDIETIFRYTRKTQTVLRKIVQYSIIISLGLIIIISIFIILSIVRPLRTITNVTEAIAEGDLSKKIRYQSRDEIGRLADSFRKMQNNLITHIDDLGTANDDLLQVNMDLKTTQVQLIQSEKMASLGRLVAGVAHEFNNPIGAIRSSSDTLESGLDRLESIVKTDDYSSISAGELNRLLKIIRDITAVINTGTHRIADIVERMKSFARLDEAELQNVKLEEIVENTIAMIRHDIKSGITIQREFCDLPSFVCYPAKLNQLCLQLLTNANQAIDKEGEITISTEIDKQSVILTITDNGRGISSEQLGKVFDPGFTDWTVGVGVGLGLAICYSIVEEHFGKINIESEVGVGTTVAVSLPLDLSVMLAK